MDLRLCHISLTGRLFLGNAYDSGKSQQNDLDREFCNRYSPTRFGRYECNVATELFGISRSLESTNSFVISGVLWTILRVAWSVCPHFYITRIINLL